MILLAIILITLKILLKSVQVNTASMYSPSICRCIATTRCQNAKQSNISKYTYHNYQTVTGIIKYQVTNLRRFRTLDILFDPAPAHLHSLLPLRKHRLTLALVHLGQELGPPGLVDLGEF